MEPLKEFGKILLTLDNCVVPRERLLNTPSAKDGMTRDVEIDIRIRGCECIQSAGLLLKLPQVSRIRGRNNSKLTLSYITGCHGHGTDSVSAVFLCKVFSQVQFLCKLNYHVIYNSCYIQLLSCYIYIQLVLLFRLIVCCHG